MDDKRISDVDDVSQDKLNEFDKPIDITYDTEKDFYKGIRGELRFKAEGLFKKAREKGISIEEIEISTAKEEVVDFPGIGNIDLPTYVVKVKGIILENQQSMVDGKQLDFYNRYKKYVADKIEEKNLVRDERGKVAYVNRKPVVNQNPDFSLTDWEKFEIAKSIIEDKEFGLEKTITGACDRVIRKLMGENDWLYPGEARLLEEEFDQVDQKISAREAQRNESGPVRKASEKQINYLKNKIRNSGLDPEDRGIVTLILEYTGVSGAALENVSMTEMSRLIDSFNDIIPQIKERINNNHNVVQ